VPTVIEFDLPLPRATPDILALGAYLKNTVTVLTGGRAYISPVIGDLDGPEAITRFEATAASLVKATGARPVRVAHDLHPDFASTRHAESWGLPVCPVQHHHAHIAAVAVEHGLTEPVLGLAFDGFGLGPNNQAWGGELLLVDGAGFEHLGHLRPLPQPGGDVAAREPWRMGAAALFELGKGDEIATRYSAHKAAALLETILVKKLNSPRTSSCGRLFDAACGLLGVPGVAELEALVTAPTVDAEGWSFDDRGLDTRPLLARLIDMTPEEGANLFHGTLAAAVVEWTAWTAQRTRLCKVALGGGCFYNKVLSRLLADGLAARGLKAYFPKRLPPGDPAISLGQAWVAALSENV